MPEDFHKPAVEVAETTALSPTAAPSLENEALASIVNSVLAELKPKLMEQNRQEAEEVRGGVRRAFLSIRVSLPEHLTESLHFRIGS